MNPELAIVNRETAIISSPQPSIIGTSLSILTMSEEQVTRIKLLAQMYEQSTFNKTRNPLSQGDYFLIMLKGLEVGINPMSAVDLISIIQGTPVLDAKGILALVKSKGLLEDIQLDGDETEYICIMKRKGESTPHKEVFTIEDAKRLQLAGKDNYIKQPKTMLKWRAITACARVVFPDVTGGLYTAEEIDPDNVTVSEDGTMKINRHESPASSTPANSKKKSQPQSDDDNGDDTKETPKWYETENGGNLTKLIRWSRDKGMVEEENDQKASVELLKLAKAQSWSEFESGKTAWAKLTAEHEAQLAELANRNASKSQADEQPEEAGEPKQSDEVETPSTSNGLETLSNKDKAELADWIKENFAGRDMPQIGEELNTDFSEFTSLGHAKNTLIKAAVTDCWAVITDMVTHRKDGKTKYLLFASPVDAIRHYSRQEFVKLLGADFPDNDKIKELPEGESLMLSEKVVVEYEAKGHYNVVTNATPLSAYIPF